MTLQRESANSWRLHVVAAILACAAAGCAGAAPVAETAPRADACAVGTPAADPFPPRPSPETTVVVGVSGEVDPAHAPTPTTPAERLLFAQLYETLVRVDCEGRVRPWLADAWRSEDGGLRWSFTIGEEGRDWIGAPVTAYVVASSLSRASQSTAAAPGDRSGVAIAHVTVVDSRTVEVAFARPATVHAFARPELAITTGIRDDGWPIGTGAYRPEPATPAAHASSRAAAGVDRGVLVRGPVTLELRPLSGDARDALDGGVDVLVTADPAVIEYAKASPSFDAVPSSWDHAYLLLAPAAAPPADSSGTATLDAASGPALIRVDPDALSALAADAVRIEARAASVLDASTCESRQGPGTPAQLSPARARRIVYPTSDGVARSIAERLVALALASARAEGNWVSERVPELTASGRASAVGLEDGIFDDALRAGRDAAYVLPVEWSTVHDACMLVDATVSRAPWLLVPPNLEDRRGPAVLPLVEARTTLVLRRGIAGVSVDGGGVLRLERVRSTPSEPRP